MSESDADDKPEEADSPSTANAPKVDAPKVGAPKADAPKADAGDSVLDSGWGSLGFSSFSPPKPSGLAPSFKPPGAAKDEPDGEKADGEKAEDAKAEDEKTEPEPAKEDGAEPEKAGSEDEKTEAEPEKEDEAGAEPDEGEGEDGDDEPPEVEERAAVERGPDPPGGGNSLLLVLAVAAAVVLAVIFVNRSGTEEAPATKSTSTKPNREAKAEPGEKKTDEGPRQDGPKPRPPSRKTHAADPTQAALHEAREAKANAASEGEGEDEDEDEGESEGADTSAGEVEEPAPSPTPAKVDDPRDPSLIPPGTPAENAKAFTKLPVSLNDGPPIGGIGRSGIHIDAISMGEGRDNSDCDDPTRSFTTDDEFINVCLRVVHPRASETLRVIWEKDGSTTRRSKLKIPEGVHAYKTRAYLQMRPEYVGSWRVRIVPEGEETTDLAAVAFTIR